MVLPMQKAINRRQQERKIFHHKVKWMHQPDNSIETNALDMSPWGIFVSADGKMIEKMNANDMVIVTIDIGKEKFDLIAKIRWTGTSVMHAKRGFGLEFDDQSKTLAEELFLKLDEDGIFFVPE